MVAVDANVIIYFLNADGELGESARDVLEGSGNLVGSELLFAEVLADGRLEDRRARKAADEIMEGLGIKYQQVSRQVLVRAAALLRKEKLRTPDAIHLASAMESGATVFVTNDKALRKLRLPGLQIVGLL